MPGMPPVGGNQVKARAKAKANSEGGPPALRPMGRKVPEAQSHRRRGDRRKGVGSGKAKEVVGLGIIAGICTHPEAQAVLP